MIVGRSHEAVVLKRLKSKKIVGVLFEEEKRGRDDMGRHMPGFQRHCDSF